MPLTGPVAYQVQLVSFTSLVISFGLVQLSPSSFEWIKKILLVSILFWSIICHSLSSPLFHVLNKLIFPDFLSNTGDGLPHVLFPSSHITSKPDQVLPLSNDFLNTKSISPVSLQLFFLPSAKAKSVPFLDFKIVERVATPEQISEAILSWANQSNRMIVGENNWRASNTLPQESINKVSIEVIDTSASHSTDLKKPLSKT